MSFRVYSLNVSKTYLLYTFNYLFTELCSSGSYFSCFYSRCLPCSPGSYQPKMGQTSCWPCPPNTTTDGGGTISPTHCKHTACVYRSTPGLAIVESPNYPAQFPARTNCHWKVKPDQQDSLLIILSSLSLPPHCSHTLSVRKAATRGGEEMFSSCSSTSEPVILTSEGGELWVDFTAGSGNNSAGGFQLSILSIADDLRHVINAVQGNTEDGGHAGQVDRIRHQVWGAQQGNNHLVSQLLSILSGQGNNKEQVESETDRDNLIQLVEETGDSEERLDHHEYSFSSVYHSTRNCD
jgi:hypothetical protein